MKITIQNTTKIVNLSTSGGTVPARIWEGQTESGIPVMAYVTRLSTPANGRLTEFENELQATTAPTAAAEAIPLRLIL